MYYKKDIQEVEKELDTSEDGLSLEQVQTLYQKYGKNILPKQKKDGIIKIFFQEFLDPIIILLLVSIVVSLMTGEVVDAIAISFIVLVDALMGAYQENKANHSVEALSQIVATKTVVIREGLQKEILAEELVVGDVVLLDSGDKVVADMRIVEAQNLMVDESILTGESVAVIKNNAVISQDNVAIADQSNMLFSGTTVVKGRARAIVVATGLKTELGRIADSMMQTKEEKSPLMIRIEKLSKQISILTLLVAIIIFFLLMGKGATYHEIFLSVIALSISAMPEGLPLALTMALTIASNKMAKKNVIVRKLKSAESLGSCTVIASDKTGTLTVNEQTAKKILLPDESYYLVSGVGFSLKGEIQGENISHASKVIQLGVINNEAQMLNDSFVGDSIDIAFQILGKKAAIDTRHISISTMIPYESENQYSAVFYQKDGEMYCTVKGSFEVVKSFCSDAWLSKDTISSGVLDAQNETLAKDGFRVIALAEGKVKKKENYSSADIKNLTFMGMVGFIDPIREEALPSIQECHRAGIKVLMITGDHPLTAFSIAKELELVSSYDEVTTGTEIEVELAKGEHSFDTFIQTRCVFARVSPYQKLKIVESLKRQGEFVAVTGDGVNDAPALKAANIGVAMGSGTDIARETADMIIVDDNFKSIVSGIKEGRVAYSNIRKIILFLMSCGLAEVLFFILSILFGLPMPLVAIQLLWINMVTDGIQDFALSFEKAEKGILKEMPRNPKESIFNRELVTEIIVSGVVIGSIIFLTWYFLLEKLHFDVFSARGYAMALMVFIQNVHVFNCRSEHRSVFSVPLRGNPLIVIGVIGSIILQMLVMEIPMFSGFLQTVSIPFKHLIYLFLLSFSVLVIMELYKKLKYK